MQVCVKFDGQSPSVGTFMKGGDVRNASIVSSIESKCRSGGSLESI